MINFCLILLFTINVIYHSYKFTNEIFINTKSNELTENLLERVILKKSYSVYENLPKMKWLLLKGDKKFNNMNCKKAQNVYSIATSTCSEFNHIKIKS